MNRPTSLSFIALMLSLLVSYTTAHAAPAGSIVVKSGQVFSIGDVTCGLVRKKNLPGKMVSANRFLSHAQERKNILASAAKASGKRKKGLIAKASRLQALIKSLGNVCAGGPAVAQAPTSTPAPTPTATPSQPAALEVISISSFPLLIGAEIYASDGQFLGVFTNNAFQATGIANEFGLYGSNFALYSIFNNFGQYGSKFALKSAFNSFSTAPPILVVEGKGIAYLTTNPSKSPRVDTNDVAFWLDRLDDAP